ncbi:thyrostimulin alpha-2 subunit-like [Limulus polyphemus]|uniref:Thyrostimulin alpha-2 subunit-like n=1 Tax=Limulus polyphemus TaxID=6850 RepID=A0ABM1S431_LIMPO|nr:thyrostimulin alpha-2 subunit-like [Limulus polyphemus]
MATCRFLLKFLLWGVALITIYGSLSVKGFAWQRPGCHKVGHTRHISIPDCVEFDITTNACRGYCVSYSIPSTEETLRINSNQAVTSIGQCCNIMETEDVKVEIMCLEGPRDLVFKSARTCACFHCKKD